MRKIASAIVAATMMLAMPVTAVAANKAESAAARLSLTAAAPHGDASAVRRAGAPIGQQSELRGGFIIPAIAIVAIILGILALTDGKDRPHTP